MVINDEAHHAWRVPAESKVKGVAKEEIDEATKWIGGLDRIHRARNILRCFDFSATPFAPSGKKSSEEALFGWIVSDFGLNDAIESGLVKTPRVVVRDNGRLTAQYKSRFYHLYRDHEVQDDVNRKAEPHVPLPDLVTRAYYFLGTDWLAAAKDWKEQGHATPPVMITVANRTETAARIKYALDHERIDIPELCAPDKTLHIDSKVLGQAEAQEQPVELAGTTDDEETDDDQQVRSETKKEKAERLRQMVDTVGQAGKPGGQIQNVISVGMLSEGWDAKTVTHIMGLRAFTSQLLCEQVVGRGLRRTTYDVNPQTGLFEPEYVNIFGVPFTFLPHEEEESNAPPPPPKPKTLVYPLRERESRFGITWPNVVRIEHVYRPELTLDLPTVKVLEINAADTPTHADLAAILEGKPNMTHLSEIDLERAGRNYRLQTITFKIARDVFEQMQPKWSGSRESLLAQVIGLVERALRSDRIRVVPELFAQDELKRRIVLTLNMNRIVQHVWEAIRFANTSRLEPVFDTQRPLVGTVDMRPWYTSRPCEVTQKSHINVAVYDSRWEASESFALERSDLVDAWVKNEHLGFEIQYVFNGVVRKYRPDYLIRLVSGAILVLEVKGQETDESRAKHQFLDEWVRAVNENGSFGHWGWDVSRDPADVAGILTKHVPDAAANPMRTTTKARPV